jgi:hypothetical protein
MSFPMAQDEQERIQKMGGEVMHVNGVWRVNGNIAVSRSIGKLCNNDKSELAGSY